MLYPKLQSSLDYPQKELLYSLNKGKCDIYVIVYSLANLTVSDVHNHAETSPSRKAFSVSLCSSFNEEKFSSSNGTDAIAAPMLTCSGIVFKFAQLLLV